MSPITFKILPPPDNLKEDIECIRIAEYTGSDELAIKVCPNGLPGIVFQSRLGKSAIKSIVTSSGRIAYAPTLFLYGQITELAVMNFKSGPYTTIQVLLKPHALRILFSMDAQTLTDKSTELGIFAGEHLASQLLATDNNQERTNLLIDFLAGRLKQAKPRDTLIKKGLDLIQERIDSISIKYVLEQLHISERQLEKRFIQSVGVSPQFYIRIRRFNEAIRLMDTGEYERLSDVAQALNFHDQSHFIRDIKVFSGITPKSISQKVNDFHHDQVGSSYLE